MSARLFIAALAALGAAPASAQMVPSTCYALAREMPGVSFVSQRASSPAPFRVAALQRDEVRITYAQHATYIIESAEGVVVATDYSGHAGPGVVPDVVTMNKAHSSHFTPAPDPGIGLVLRGWNPEGGPARHAETVGDVYIRNVPTDIQRYGAFEEDGNSIFVFEVAGLCIGHLGHLHHELTNDHYAAIGRLDIVMVPVDGGYTMSQTGIGDIAARLRSSIVLPMHRFRTPIERFLAQIPDFKVERRAEASFTISMRGLPERPTVILLSGV
ncbi:MBL fold metallo-hydrolase [Aureimonas populi]|uniref:MBL fold metallo-hydrolase n=1 Tax=Aureimonas populi TaxID=1701758 RepID=A0ABW5CJI6_9HYPH|nr:MBL fold metallo-hydrolase [Aureimonas populi]